MFPSEMTNTGLSLGFEKIILHLLLEYANTVSWDFLNGKKAHKFEKEGQSSLLTGHGRVMYLQRHHNLKWKVMKAHKEG